MADTPAYGAAGIWACSVVGMVRDHNEDAVLAKQWTAAALGPLGLNALLAVADGMGGHHDGEWASQTALTILEQELSAAAGRPSVAEALEEAVRRANQVIFEERPGTGAAHPGTTLTAAVIRGSHCLVAHVGDSRLYLVRSGLLQQTTTDDTWAHELVQRKEMKAEDVANWPHRNQLTKAVGIAPSVQPAMVQFDLQEDDVLLLCSDGLTGMVSDARILDVISGSGSVTQAAESLCAEANRAGGEDNITVLLYAHGVWPGRPPALGTRELVASRAPTPLPGYPAPHRSRSSRGRRLAAAAGVLAFLAVGLRLLIVPTADRSSGKLTGPATTAPAATAASQMAATPPKASATSPGAKTPPVSVSPEIHVKVNEEDGTIIVSAKGADFVYEAFQDAPGDWEPRSNGESGIYRFKNARGSLAMLRGSEVSLRVVGKALSRSLRSNGHTRDWAVPAEAPGEYTITWNGTPVAKFRLEANGARPNPEQ